MKKNTKRFNANLLESFNNAIEGFICVLKNKKNMKYYFVLAFLAIVLSILLNFSLIKVLILLVVIFLVFFAEIFNTVIENILNKLQENTDDIKIIKRIAASSVLISCLLALIVGYLLFVPPLNKPIENILTTVRFSPWNITFISLLAVVVSVILGKAFFHKGRPLRGGMPSGHSAFAFSIWTITALSQPNTMITILVLILVLMVARSRISNGVHTLWEVMSGALLGFLITLLFFQILG